MQNKSFSFDEEVCLGNCILNVNLWGLKDESSIILFQMAWGQSADSSTKRADSSVNKTVFIILCGFIIVDRLPVLNMFLTTVRVVRQKLSDSHRPIVCQSKG